MIFTTRLIKYYDPVAQNNIRFSLVSNNKSRKTRNFNFSRMHFGHVCYFCSHKTSVMIRLAFKILAAWALLLMTAPVSGQNKEILIKGKVLESTNRTPVEYATIILKDRDDKLISGTSASETGGFEVSASQTPFLIEISFIGFVSKKIDDFREVNGQIDLGEILLGQDARTLDEIKVRGERSQTEFHLDKRVFNVGQDLASTGASALEVLNNVPSVTVNIQGQISLRGSQGVRILINGKPSVLATEGGNALGSITAEMIEKIEVITNPSAKYDAEGTSGIINIVLKKEEKNGVNGSVTINAGIPNNHSVGLSINRRTQKLNLFSQAGVGYRTFPTKFRSINESGDSKVETSGSNRKNEQFYNLILGADYHLNKLNMLSVSGHYGFEKETENADSDFLLSNAGTVESGWSRNESTWADNPKWQYDVQYQKSFEDDEKHKLLVSATGNFFGKNQFSDFTHKLTKGTASLSDQKAHTDFKEAEYVFKADYTKPFSKEWSLEAGAQYQIKDISSDFAVQNRIDGGWQTDPNLTNVFVMDQDVLAAYATGAYEGKKVGVKLGLRAENTLLNTRLENTGETNDQKYLPLFPSAHTSYKFTSALSLQAGYSRRIYRPGLWELNPFFSIQNNYNIRSGNPLLMPEYTDSYEVTGIYDLSALAINAGVYHRYTTDAIDNIATVENNVRTTKPANIGTRKATGLELNAKYAPGGWLSLSTDLNYNYFTRDGEYESTVYDFSADQFTSRLTSKLKLPAGFDLELTGNYRSGYRTLQGYVTKNAYLDLGVRNKLFKGKTIVNLSIRDVFASRFFETTINQPDFALYNHSRMGRFVTLGISYGFGKGEAMQFSGQKMF